MMRPTICRSVVFVTKHHERRAAIVIADPVGDRVCLHVFLKPTDELHESAYQPLVPYSPTGEPGTWHFPDRIIPPEEKTGA